MKYLESNQITYWIEGGTLLGAVRNNKMIEWDDDIDLFCPHKYYIKLLKKIVQLPKKKSYYIDNENRLKWKILDLYNDDLKKFKKKSLFKNEHIMIKSYNLDNKNIFIDIMYCNIYKQYYTGNIIPWSRWFRFHIKDVYPLKKIKFENIMVPCVNNPIPYLNYAYWFWKHLAVISHTHTDELKDSVNKNIWYILKYM